MFKVGDIVRIKDNSFSRFADFNGQIGVIVDIGILSDGIQVQTNVKGNKDFKDGCIIVGSYLLEPVTNGIQRAKEALRCRR